jgi:putative membrane protein
MSDTAPRRPRVFEAEDPAVTVHEVEEIEAPPAARPADAATAYRIPTLADVKSGVGWGALFLSAMLALASLALALWFARFVSVTLAREDWIGWLATGLVGAMAVAALAIAGRELVGLMRLRRLTRLRKDAETAVTKRDKKLASSVVRRLKANSAGRKELAWGLAQLSRHERDILGPGELLKLADREVVAPLDREARRIVVQSSKRVLMVTALSPMMLVAVGFVAVENLRMLRKLATLYGGRPGAMGALRLAKLVIGHIIATGGIALTDDLLGQFLGQDLVRRLSRRLGEGAFNGALTARVGTAALDVCRPLPFLEATPPRLRDVLAEVLKREKTGAPATQKPEA